MEVRTRGRKYRGEKTEETNTVDLWGHISEYSLRFMAHTESFKVLLLVCDEKPRFSSVYPERGGA